MNMLNRNNYTPDVLDCLANLSSDEVFTPPEVANKLLDMLPQEIFKSKETTFLDPFTKSGVFLREITKRLLEGQIPNYEIISNEIDIIEKTAIQEAVRIGLLDLTDCEYEEKAKKIGRDTVRNHPRAYEFYNFEDRLQEELNRILTKQVFGIAITELTAQLARRSLYCSKDAIGHYSVCTAFGINSAGNIKFVPMKHTWKNNSCIYCGISKNTMDRPNDFETHAYEFIHTEKVEVLYNMKFTVICGNPPYQLNDGGGTGDSAKPIYNKFIEQAIKLNPKYLTMIVPSRWMKGGKGLDSFRETMINDTRIVEIHDFENAKECFPNVHIDGGVNYFLWAKDYHGTVKYFYKPIEGDIIQSDRLLKTNLSDIVIRDYRQISIIEKVMKLREEMFDSIVSAQKPYGFRADLFNTPGNYPNAHLKFTYEEGYTKIYGVKGIKGGAKRTVGYVKTSSIEKGTDDIERHKLLFSKAYSANATVPPEIIYCKPGEICTETFLQIGTFDTQQEAINCLEHIKTKFFRALLFFGRAGMNNSKKSFQFIPIQDFTKSWTDEELYKKYNLSDDEIKFIDLMIKPMGEISDVTKIDKEE